MLFLIKKVSPIYVFLSPKADVVTKRHSAIHILSFFFLSWEKLPTKYARMFNEMQQLMDPSRNMSRYRNLVTGEDVQPPIIPFYPVVKKDLTFIHLANDSKVESLVNFEKLRMIAKEVSYFDRT